MGQWPQSLPFPKQILVFSLTCLLQSSVPSDRWAGMRLPLQMLIFWPAVNNTQGSISLQSPSALSLLRGTKLKGSQITGRGGQESAWPCLFHVFLGLGEAGSLLVPEVPAPPLKANGDGFSWHFLFRKNMDKIKKSFFGVVGMR